MKRLACLLWVTACGFTGSATPADPDPDAAPDVTPTCVTGLVSFCVNEALAERKSFAGVTVIDTAASTECAATTPTTGGDVCIIFARNITVEFGAEVRAHGLRPLALVALDTLTVRGKVDVSSSRERPTQPGAGSRMCTHKRTVGNDTAGAGGAAGGSQGSKGGDGGAGDTDGGGADTEFGQASDPIARPSATLVGGCHGQKGGTGMEPGGEGGFGGGAVYLRGTLVTIESTGSVLATGQGGAGGGFEGGGGGGGSGGVIAIQVASTTAPPMVSGTLLATGGGGGEGGDSATRGNSGLDPIGSTTAALGGSGGGPGGNGGNGARTGMGAGNTAQPGMGSAGGGGGGGGGTGHIFYLGPMITAGSIIESVPGLVRVP